MGCAFVGCQGAGAEPRLYTIADAATGLRAGQRAALGETPCHGDIFHIQQQCEGLANRLARLARREQLDSARIRPVRVALKRQRDRLPGFAKVLDGKLAAIAQRFDVPEYQVRAVCLLQRKPETSQAYWQRRKQLNRPPGWKFHGILEAVSDAMDETHRSSPMVGNLNGRLRNYFFLRRHLGQGYLDLLRFFLNHRPFARSEHPGRVGKSPAEPMTGKRHPHWLELLGFERFHRSPFPA
ncbi:MAG: hypothetical protein NTX45_00515 [Proteobacteria bacterium]|nr:hypothetical protein [Pseudomonadota bacterium]